MVTPRQTSAKKAVSIESLLGKRLQLRQRQGQAGYAHIHWQALKYKILQISASTIVSYPTYMGETPGPLRDATGNPPSATAERSIARSRLGGKQPRTAEDTAPMRSFSRPRRIFARLSFPVAISSQRYVNGRQLAHDLGGLPPLGARDGGLGGRLPAPRRSAARLVSGATRANPRLAAAGAASAR